MRVLRIKLRVEIENEMRVFLESLNFEIEMRVLQKSGLGFEFKNCFHLETPCDDSKYEKSSNLISMPMSGLWSLFGNMREQHIQ